MWVFFSLFCFLFCCLFDWLICFVLKPGMMTLMACVCNTKANKSGTKISGALAGQPALLGGHLLLRVDSGDRGGNCSGDVK